MDRSATTGRSGDRRWLAVLVAVALVAVACGAAPSSSPTATPSPSVGPSPSAAGSPTPSPSSSGAASPSPSAADVQALTDTIAGQVAGLRELDLRSRVTAKVLDEAGLVDFVTAAFAAENPPEYVAATQALYQHLGLLPAGSSLQDLYVSLLGSQVLGLYDDESKQLYVVSRGDGIGPLERFTMSHELTHAITDQHFDLSTLEPKGVRDQSDRAMAHLAVAEGDATDVMFQWAGRYLTGQELGAVLAAGADPGQLAILEGMPPILSLTLQFPYIQGLELVEEAQRSGGWPAVDALYGAPPASTEQLLHPEKYAAHEAPIPVAMPADLATTLGAGWSVPLEDTFGEYQLSIWLSSPAKAISASAATAAAGWGGDRLALVAGPQDAWAVVLRTTWDSSTDAREFLTAATATTGRLGSPRQVVPDPTDPNGVWVVLGGDQATMCQVAAAVGLAGCTGA